MSQEYFVILTAVGEAKHANAALLGTKVDYATLAVGDGNGVVPEPKRGQTALVNQKRREAINSASIDPANPSQIIIEQVIPANEGGWWIREAGIYDADGDLIAVGSVPPSYKPQLVEGSGRDMVVRLVLLLANTSVVSLKIDPSVVIATRQYVDSKVAAIPAASTETRGLIEIATAAEVAAGTDTQRAVTPAHLRLYVPSVWDTIPQTFVGKIIFVEGIGEMWWVENDWLVGYRTKECGMLRQSFDHVGRSWALELSGGTFDRTLPKYRGLFSYVMENNLLVPGAAYKDHEGFFGDLGNNIIKLPNQDNMFWRNKGTDADTANPAEPGYYQRDALQNIIGGGAKIIGSGPTGALYAQGDVADVAVSSGVGTLLGFDASRSPGVRTSTETRVAGPRVAAVILI